MTLTVTDLLADIEPVVRGWIAEQIGDNANSNIPGDQFEFEFTDLSDGDILYYDGTALEWKNTEVVVVKPGVDITIGVGGDTLYIESQDVLISSTANDAAGLVHALGVGVAGEQQPGSVGDGAILSFRVADDNNGAGYFADLVGVIVDPTPASKDGYLMARVMVANSLTEIMRWQGTGTNTAQMIAIGDGGAVTLDRWLDIDGSLSFAGENFGALISPSVGANQNIIAGYFRVDVDDNFTAPEATAIRVKAARLGAGSAATLAIGIELEEQTVGGTNYTLWYEPGSDKDMNLFSVNVTGTPTAIWDESEDRIDYSHGLAIQGASIIDVTSTEALNIRKNADGGDVFIVDTNTPDVTIFGDVLIERAADDGGAFHYVVRKKRLAGDGAVQDGDQLWVLRGQGWDGDQWVDGVQIRALVDGTPGDNDMPGEIQFLTTPDNSDTGLLRMSLKQSGNLLINVTDDSNNIRLYVVEGDQIYAARFDGNQAGAVVQIHNSAANGFPGIEFLDNNGNIDMFQGLSNADGHYRFNALNSNEIVFMISSGIKMAIDTSADVRIGAASASGQLHVDQPSATGAQPVLFLDQGDVSEQIIKASYSGADVDMIIIELDVDGAPKFGWSETPNVFTLSEGLAIADNNELRLHDNGNYVGFEAPALSADQIWVLPTADGVEGSVLSTDGSGTLQWDSNASEKSWAFMSRDANTGTNYIGGYYKFETSDNDFNPAVTFGTANASYAAHFFLVQAAGGAGGTDTVIRVTGTTIDDQGNRTAAVDVDITVDDAGAAGTYYETTEKWIGQVTVEKQSGPDLLCNYGFCKYWDNSNSDFKVVGFEATWLGAKNDATPNIIIRHHKATGWTYNNAAAPTPPSAISDMVTDHNTEIQIRTDEEGAWKRDNLSTVVSGSSGEGTMIELLTTTNRTYAIGNFIVRIVPQ